MGVGLCVIHVCMCYTCVWVYLCMGVCIIHVCVWVYVYVYKPRYAYHKKTMATRFKTIVMISLFQKVVFINL